MELRTQYAQGVIGSAIEVLVTMPEEITGEPTTEWRCTGHVVRLEPVETPPEKSGVGVQFDCYEILRSKSGEEHAETRTNR